MVSEAAVVYALLVQVVRAFRMVTYVTASYQFV